MYYRLPLLNVANSNDLLLLSPVRSPHMSNNNIFGHGCLRWCDIDILLVLSRALLNVYLFLFNLNTDNSKYYEINIS